MCCAGTGSPADTTAWVLASDYLGGSGTSYPAVGGATTLGMCWALASWPGEAALQAGLDPPLTAVGSGDPTFAAYLPNVQHILAFHDPLTNVPAGPVSYTVCGWYGAAATDPLSGPQYGQAGWQITDQWTTIMSQLGWSAGRRHGQRHQRRPGVGHRARVLRQPDQSPDGAAVADRLPRHRVRGDLARPGRGGAVRRAHGGSRPGGRAGPDTRAHLGRRARHHRRHQRRGIRHRDLRHRDLRHRNFRHGGRGSAAPRCSAAPCRCLTSRIPARSSRSSCRTPGSSSSPGGTRWVLAAPQGTGGQPVTTTPTAAQGQLLDALNAAQQQVDADTREVASLQWDIYALWWKLSYVTANGAPTSDPNVQQVITPALTAKETAASQALTALQAAVTQLSNANKAMQAQLGTLVLQAVPEPPFLRPNDPVAMVQGARAVHGARGRRPVQRRRRAVLPVHRADPGLAGGHRHDRAGHRRDPGGGPGTRRRHRAGRAGQVADLAVESFFLDPANAQAIAAAADPTSPQPTSDVAPQLTLSWVSTGDPSLGQQTSAGAPGLASAYGPLVLPSMIAVGTWAAPWSPLYLDWSATYYAAPYPASGWTFPDSTTSTPLDAQTAQWTATQSPTAGATLQGRALLTPQAADVLASRLEQLVAQAGDDGALAPYVTDINDATTYLGTADVLSQALSGFTDLMLQRDPTLVQQPDLTTLGQWLAPPGGPAFTATTAPSAASGVPITPVRAGFLLVNELWVVDDFGQYFDVLGSMAGDPAGRSRGDRPRPLPLGPGRLSRPPVRGSRRGAACGCGSSTPPTTARWSACHRPPTPSAAG